MKYAGADFLIWLIIAVVVIVAKAYGKLQEGSDEESAEPPPPPPRPRSRPAVENRPRSRPSDAVPPQRTATHGLPPVVPSRTEAARPAEPPRDLREFMEQFKQATLPSARPKPVTPAPVAKPAQASHPPPVATKPAPQPTEPPPAKRSSQWAAALRDRGNLRNIIISAEIIGPPKGSSPFS